MMNDNMVFNVFSSSSDCPHMFLGPISGEMFTGEVNPKIKKFIDEYGIEHIDEPNNHCNHK